MLNIRKAWLPWVVDFVELLALLGYHDSCPQAFGTLDLRLHGTFACGTQHAAVLADLAGNPPSGAFWALHVLGHCPPPFWGNATHPATMLAAKLPLPVAYFTRYAAVLARCTLLQYKPFALASRAAVLQPDGLLLTGLHGKGHETLQIRILCLRCALEVFRDDRLLGRPIG